MTQAKMFIKDGADWVPATTSNMGGAGGGGSATDREVVVTTYTVKTAFTGASVNDTITCTQVLDVSASPSTVSTIWRNQTTAADLASAPSAANLTLVGAGGATEATLAALSAKVPALSGGKTPTADADVLQMTTNVAARLGATDDAAAASDGATASLIALFKRFLGKFPSLTLARTVLLNAVTATGAGAAVADSGRNPSFDASLTGTGTVSATILIQGRNTTSGAWITLGTITLSGSASAGDAFASLTRYMEYRANLTAISGTSATVTVTMGS